MVAQCQGPCVPVNAAIVAVRPALMVAYALMDKKRAQRTDSRIALRGTDQGDSKRTKKVLPTSNKWRLQSPCNHSTAYVDQWKSYESSDFLTKSHDAALCTEDARQDLKKSKDVC